VKDEADQYEQRWARYLNVTHSKLLASLPAGAAPRSILDLGCGTGLLLTKLRQHYPDAQLTGVDRSGAMLDQARQRLPQATFIETDLARLHLNPRQYDLIVSSSVFHFVDVALVLSQITPALDPNGWLVVVDYSGESWFRAVGWLYDHFLEAQQALSRRQLARQLTAAGLTVEHQQQFRWRWYLLQVVTAQPASPNRHYP